MNIQQVSFRPFPKMSVGCQTGTDDLLIISICRKFNQVTSGALAAESLSLSICPSVRPRDQGLWGHSAFWPEEQPEAAPSSMRAPGLLEASSCLRVVWARLKGRRPRDRTRTRWRDPICLCFTLDSLGKSWLAERRVVGFALSQEDIQFRWQNRSFAKINPLDDTAVILSRWSHPVVMAPFPLRIFKSTTIEYCEEHPLQWIQ